MTYRCERILVIRQAGRAAYHKHRKRTREYQAAK